MSPASREPKRGSEQSGQTLVEFALVIPFVMLLFMALVELALAFNAFIAINRASQNGGHLAAIMTNQVGSDCLILQEIEADVDTPNKRSNIVNVVVERTALAGNYSYQNQHYDRVGQMTCTLPNGSDIDVPYTLRPPTVDEPAYPEDERCPVLKGCPDLGRSTVDNIGVKVRYRHDWVTPLAVTLDILPGGRNGWVFTQRNIFRMEPTL